LAPQSGDGARAGEDLLAFAGLLKQADQRIATLSAGQRRRLALTRLMAAPRRVWLLDEPYTALDGGGRELVDTLIRRQAEAGGLVILAAHEPVPLADHQLVLNA
jgi:heme exporter protein A